MSANAINPLNTIVNDFLVYALEEGESRGFDWETIEGLKKLWTEKKEKFEEKMKKEVDEALPKSKKSKKPKNAPKNPKSAYIFYCQDERENVKTEMPDLSAKEILKELGGRWQGTSEETRAKYQEMAKDDKERYNEEMKNYVPAPDSEEPEKKQKKKRAKKAKDAPKNASSPYIFFCKDERENVKTEMPELTAKEIMTELGNRWKAIKDTEKADKYKKLAEEDKVRYAEDMKNYVPVPEGQGQESEKKERKKRAKKAKDAPKNASSPYIFFCKDERENVKTEMPELTAKEIMTELGNRWKAIKDTEKADKYKKLAEEDKVRYTQDMKTYVPKDEDEQDDEEKPKKERKQRTKKPADAPKNAKTSYMFYCERNRDSIKKKNPELKGKEVTSKLAEEWNKIKETKEAKKYQKMADEDKKRYQDEMIDYKEKHLDTNKEEEDNKPKDLFQIITEIIDNADVDTITKGYIKKQLKGMSIEYTKEEFEKALKKTQE